MSRVPSDKALPSSARAHEASTTAERVAVAPFLVSSFISFVGANAIAFYATVVFTHELTGSHALAGLFFFLNFVPSFVLGLYSGVLLDTYSRKKFSRSPS